MSKKTVLTISDIHYPFAHRDHLDFLQEVNEKYSPDEVVCIGDECDFHAISDWDHSPNGFSPQHEYKAALKDMHKLYALFPRVKSCISNHTARPYRRAYKFGIPEEFLKSYRDLLEAPKGWAWANKWEIDGIIYEHGEKVGGKFAHRVAATQNMQSTVIGHLHSNAGVSYVANPKFLIFGMAVGCLLDNDTYAFAYGKHAREKPILGVGVVDKGIPMFVPMLLQSGGRWVGKL